MSESLSATNEERAALPGQPCRRGSPATATVTFSSAQDGACTSHRTASGKERKIAERNGVQERSPEP